MATLVAGKGFLGSYLEHILQERGEEVYCPPRSEVDFSDEKKTYEYLGDMKISAVINCAARVGGILDNSRFPMTYFLDGIRPAISLTRAAVTLKLDKFVSVGSVCAYPHDAAAPFREDRLWDGYPEPNNRAYGEAKRAIYVLLQSAYKEYGLKTFNPMLTGIYGPGDDFEPDRCHVIPGLIRKFMGPAQDIEIWGDGTPTRDFLYVADAARGILDLMPHFQKGECVNLGSGREVPISELVEIVSKITNTEKAYHFNPKKPNGQQRRVLDITAAQSYGFEPTTSLEDGLKNTVAWYVLRKEAYA